MAKPAAATRGTSPRRKEAKFRTTLAHTPRPPAFRSWRLETMIPNTISVVMAPT